MKFERTKVYNMYDALYGMRNPLESYNRFDSVEDTGGNCTVGPNDMKLAQTLIRAGGVHRKFLRQIFVKVDITAPMYWWAEMDTYKVGTVANSTSKMHKLSTTPILFKDFETDDFEDVNPYEVFGREGNGSRQTVELFLTFLEELRLAYLETKDLKYWKELIRWLPESWTQKRTWTANYETLLGMCAKDSRRNHKLNEWSGQHKEVDEYFIKWARSLPYAQEFIFPDELKDNA